MAKRILNVAFKAYQQNQAMLLPPSLDELINQDHPVRIVNQVLNKIDIDPLLKKYKGGGSSSFHPRMLLKVLVYAYINTYSSRKIEAALKENIHFMWLSGMSTPDHNTINRFRSDRLKEVLRQIFTQVVVLLADQGLLTIKELYTDGTKIEANANRYTFVWGNAIKTSKERIKKQLDELWQYAQSVAAAELPDTDPSGFKNIDPQKVEDTINQIDAALTDKKEVSAKVKQKLNYAKKNWPANLKKYEQQEQILNGRNSYSKTDTDASFMRMKEDHMLNGPLKPGYSLQISTNNQYIVNYSLHQTTADTTTLQAHTEIYKEQYKCTPEVMTADGGYGSEENYQYLQENEIENYVKYNYFDREQRNKEDVKQPFKINNLYYNEEKDCYYCPMGQQMRNIGTHQTTSKTGFVQTITRYQARNCNGCPLRGVCHKASENRVIDVNHALIKYKQKVKENLTSEKGVYHRKKRCADVEPVFANIKNNHSFKRYMLRTKPKVEIETGLLALAHNLRKKMAS